MLKILVFITLMMICNTWASGLSCQSCGSECVSACGTRRFRICCFNHLRRKRGPNFLQIEDNPDYEEEGFMEKEAIFVIDEPERWPKRLVSHINPYSSSLDIE